MREEKTVPVTQEMIQAGMTAIQGSCVTIDSPSVITSEMALNCFNAMLAAAPSAEPVAQGGETNAATRDANADKPREGAAIDTSPAPTRLVQVGDCTCSDHECGQCMRPVAPTLTKERINWLEKVLDIEDIDGNDLTQECKQLCDLARIGLQCLQAEPVAWMVHRGEIWNTKMSPYKDEIGQPLIVQPEVLK